MTVHHDHPLLLYTPQETLVILVVDIRSSMWALSLTKRYNIYVVAQLCVHRMPVSAVCSDVRSNCFLAKLQSSGPKGWRTISNQHPCCKIETSFETPRNDMFVLSLSKQKSWYQRCETSTLSGAKAGESSVLGDKRCIESRKTCLKAHI